MGEKTTLNIAIFAMDVPNTIGQIKLNISFVTVLVVASSRLELLRLLHAAFCFVCKSFCPSGKLSSDEEDGLTAVFICFPIFKDKYLPWNFCY